LPASAAHSNPAAPAPKITTSKSWIKGFVKGAIVRFR
jgi:hypothetical protein